MLIHDLLQVASSAIKQTVLVDISPTFKYENGLKTNEISGYRYTVVLPDFKFEKIAVKIEGAKQLDYNAEQGAVSVRFDGLTLGAYSMKNSDAITVTASAKAIHTIK